MLAFFCQYLIRLKQIKVKQSGALSAIFWKCSQGHRLLPFKPHIFTSSGKLSKRSVVFRKCRLKYNCCWSVSGPDNWGHWHSEKTCVAYTKSRFQRNQINYERLLFSDVCLETYILHVYYRLRIAKLQSRSNSGTSLWLAFINIHTCPIGTQ